MSSCPSSGHVRLYGRANGYLYWSPSLEVAPHDGRLSTATRSINRHRGVRVGSARCPWTVIVDPGQRINVSLAALLPYPPGTAVDTAVPCRADLIVEEPAPTKTGSHVTLRTNVCKQRRQVLVTSSGNVLQLYIDSLGGADAPPIAILLHFTGYCHYSSIVVYSSQIMTAKTHEFLKLAGTYRPGCTFPSFFLF